MAFTRLKDAVVKLRSYTDRDGNLKAQWHNVGALMRGDDGNEFLLLDRHFNPAGIPNPDGRGNVIISFFDPKVEEGRPRPDPARQAPAKGTPDDEIPF